MFRPQKAPSLAALAFVLGIGLGSCGGPTQTAKVANAIEVLLASILEGNVQVSQQSASNSAIPCAESGSFTVADAALGSGGLDPLNPGAAELDSAVTFNQCVIKVCGQTYTLDGSGSTIVMNAADADALAGTGKKTFSLKFVADGQSFAGIIEGSQSFSYKMNATVGTTIEDITIEDTDPAKPLSYGGTTYSGANIVDLADGC